MYYGLHLIVFVLFNLVSWTRCWQYFTSLGDLTLYASQPDPEVIHSEYTYGNCKAENMKFYAHVHKDHMEVIGKIIIRGWLDIPRIPTCIVIRAMSYEVDLFRSTAYNFQICVPRITYCHTRKRFKYFYYEWYIPYEMVGGMNYEIYFYGPINLTWQ